MVAFAWGRHATKTREGDESGQVSYTAPVCTWYLGIYSTCIAHLITNVLDDGLE